jgi:voltage-gated potassium channel
VSEHNVLLQPLCPVFGRQSAWYGTEAASKAGEMTRWAWSHLNRGRVRWTLRPLIISIVLLLLVISIGTLGYTLIEGWSPWDGFWMVLITLTSIGYGEVHPLSDAGRGWTVLIIVSGLSLGTYALTRITAVVVEGDLLKTLRDRKRRRDVSKLSNHYIVVGAGRLGTSVIDEVRGAGLQVCVIERDSELAAVVEKKGVPVIIGDGADDSVLRLAGVDRAAGMAVAVPSGAEAIFVTLSARHLAPKLPIATRAGDQQEAIKARRAGATSVVSPFRMGGWRMAHGLIRPSTSNFLDLATLSAHEDVLIDELLISDKNFVCDQSLLDMDVRARFGVLVVAILRRDGEMIAAPAAATLLCAGDVVIVVGPPEGVRRLGDVLS